MLPINCAPDGHGSPSTSWASICTCTTSLWADSRTDVRPCVGTIWTLRSYDGRSYDGTCKVDLGIHHYIGFGDPRAAQCRVAASVAVLRRVIPVGEHILLDLQDRRIGLP